MSPAGLTSRCAFLAPLVDAVPDPDEAADACGARAGEDVTPDPSEEAAVVDTTGVDDVAAVVAGDVRAIVVEVGAAGEALPHAVTQTSPAVRAITDNFIRSVDFMRSP